MNRKAQWLRAGTLATLLVTGVLSSGFADSALLGIAVRPENRVLSSKTKERYQVDGGVLVEYVQPDSPADQADIRVGDLIVSFQGRKIADWDALMAAVNVSSPGTGAMVGLIRGDKTMDIKVVLGWRPTEGQQEQATGQEVAPPQKRNPFTLRTFLMALAAPKAAQGQQPVGDQGQGLAGNADAGNQNSESNQDEAAAVERARIQREEEERQRQEQERQRVEEERQRQLQWQREQLEQEQERAQQRYLQERQFQHDQEMLRLQWMYRPPCPPVGGSYAAAPPRYYYRAPAQSYSRGSSAPMTLPQFWHGMLGVGGALLDAGADTIGALVGK